MTGLPIVMGTDRSTNETFIQLAGARLCISVANLRKTMTPGSSLHQCFLLYVHAFSVQTTKHRHRKWSKQHRGTIWPAGF
jgi:hypothetical protein